MADPITLAQITQEVKGYKLDILGLTKHTGTAQEKCIKMKATLYLILENRWMNTLSMELIYL